MNQITITYIVSYVDPDRPVEGTEKIRHFPAMRDALTFIGNLPSSAPNASAISLVKQETITKRTRLQ